jgi:hypothetical protein
MTQAATAVLRRVVTDVSTAAQDRPSIKIIADWVMSVLGPEADMREISRCPWYFRVHLNLFPGRID